MVFSSHYTSTSLRPSCTVTVSGSPDRVLEIGFWASFLHKHIVLCTGCEYRGHEGVACIRWCTQTANDRSTHTAFPYTSALKTTVRTDSAIPSDLVRKNSALSWDPSGLYGRPQVSPPPRYRRGDDTSMSC